MNEFCQVIISATSKKEADSISDSLVAKKLIAGSLIIKGPSRYWWNDKIVEKEYYNIQAFSLMKKKDQIINDVKKIHSDECPIHLNKDDVLKSLNEMKRVLKPEGIIYLNLKERDNLKTLDKIFQ